jgi:hypothetical protein
MTIQDQAAAIRTEFYRASQAPYAHKFNSFKTAIRNADISIKANPKLLLCKIDRQELFLHLKNFIKNECDLINDTDIKYLFWNWLVAIYEIAQAGPLPHIEGLISPEEVNNFNFLYLPRLEVNFFISVISSFCVNRNEFLRALSSIIINSHYESILNREARKYSAQQRSKMIEFINIMRLESIVTEATVARWTEIAYGDQGVNYIREHGDMALEFFRSQNTYNGFKITSAQLLRIYISKFLANPSIDEALVARIYIMGFDKHSSLEEQQEFARELCAMLQNFFLTPHAASSALEFMLAAIFLEQAKLACDNQYIKFALNRASIILKRQNTPEDFQYLYTVALGILAIVQTNKAQVADVLIEPLRNKYALTDKQAEAAKQYMLIHNNVTLGDLLCNIMFRAELRNTSEANARPIAKRNRPG